MRHAFLRAKLCMSVLISEVIVLRWAPELFRRTLQLNGDGKVTA
jgi:hypothetical protein